MVNEASSVCAEGDCGEQHGEESGDAWTLGDGVGSGGAEIQDGA